MTQKNQEIKKRQGEDYYANNHYRLIAVDLPR